MQSDWWAPYQPSQAEVAYQVRCYGCSPGEAHWRASSWTYSADCSLLPEVMLVAGGRLRQVWGARWRPLLVIGVSNGCIPAFEFAELSAASGLWLCSGVATDEQQLRFAGVAGRTIVSACRGECYWGGCCGVFRAAPGVGEESMGCFEGGHGAECSTPHAIDWAIGRLRGFINNGY